MKTKPCPFCGNEHLSISGGKLGFCGLGYHVFCNGCFIYGPQTLTEEEAIEIWNKRYEEISDKESPKIDEVEQLIRFIENSSFDDWKLINRSYKEVLIKDTIHLYNDGINFTQIRCASGEILLSFFPARVFCKLEEYYEWRQKNIVIDEWRQENLTAERRFLIRSVLEKLTSK